MAVFVGGLEGRMTNVSFEVWAREPKKKRKHERPHALVACYPERQWERSLKVAFKLARTGYEDVAVREVTITHIMAITAGGG